MIPLKRDQFTQSGSPVPVKGFGFDFVIKFLLYFTLFIAITRFIMTRIITKLLLNFYCCYCNKGMYILAMPNSQDSEGKVQKKASVFGGGLVV
jgi:hypothetical protein